MIKGNCQAAAAVERFSVFRKRFIAGVVACLVLSFLIGRLGPALSTRWHNLNDGMTPVEVRQALGVPAWTGNSECIGAGGKNVTRWQYRQWQLGRSVYYCVDFDYIGPGGSPVVFRTEHFEERWIWPWAWLARAKCR